MRQSVYLVGREIVEIPTPALLLDLDALDSNLDTMAKLFEHGPCSLRPHFKTHKCVAIAHLQMRKGAAGITCAKLGEAEVCVHAGIADVLIANQIVSAEKLAVLAGLARYASVSVAVDHPSNCTEISRQAKRMRTTVGLFLEVDVGLQRSGVKGIDEAVQLVKYIKELENVEFRGILAYEGSLCGLPAEEKRQKVEAAMKIAMETKVAIENSGIQVRDVSAGGTGTWHLTGKYPGVTEIQPGTYVHMETRFLEEEHPFKPALSILATVISKSADKLIIDAGLKAITNDQGPPGLFDYPKHNLELNEEHGKILLDDAIRHVQVGDKLKLMPSHACTTVNLHDHYVCVRWGYVEAVWEINARGRIE